jgi:hypothetical protein
MATLEYALPPKSGEAALLKSRTMGLLVACPLLQDNPVDCPLHALRRQPLRERYRWLNELPPTQVQRLLEQHAECFNQKNRQGDEPA